MLHVPAADFSVCVLLLLLLLLDVFIKFTLFPRASLYLRKLDSKLHRC